jgi:hypothetical protein
VSDSVIAVCAPCTSRLRDQRASAAGSVSSEKENRARFAPPRPQFDRLYSTNTTLNCNPINTLAAPFLQGPDSPISDSPSVLTMLPVVLSRTLGRPCSRLRCRLSTLRVDRRPSARVATRLPLSEPARVRHSCLLAPAAFPYHPESVLALQ